MPEENLSSLRKAGKTILELVKVLLMLAYIIALGFFWLFAVIGIPFYTAHRLFYFIVINMLFFGLLGLFVYAVEKQKKTVVLDRPFVYAIVDTNSMLPIFIGTVTDI